MPRKRVGKDGQELPVYRKNPWLEDLASISRVRSKIITSEDKNKMAYIGDRQTGELDALGGAGFYYRRKMESNQFVKMYTAGISEVIGLSKAGAKVFVYLFNTVSESPVNSTSVILKYEHMTEDKRYFNNGKPISKATFQNGLKDLIEHEFIAQSDIAGVFFFNPQYMFNGDRLIIIQEFIKDKMQKPTALPEVKNEQ